MQIEQQAKSLTSRLELPWQISKVIVKVVPHLLKETGLIVLLPLVQCNDKQDGQIGYSDHSDWDISRDQPTLRILRTVELVKPPRTEDVAHRP